MNSVKVVFTSPDEVLLSLIRGLACKAGGRGIANKESTDAFLHANRFCRFRFLNEVQVDRFKEYVRDYAAARFQPLIQIVEETARVGYD
jgi:hypothetical protein